MPSRRPKDDMPRSGPVEPYERGDYLAITRPVNRHVALRATGGRRSLPYDDGLNVEQ